jgi:hypothetical protein
MHEIIDGLRLWLAQFKLPRGRRRISALYEPPEAMR